MLRNYNYSLKNERYKNKNKKKKILVRTELCLLLFFILCPMVYQAVVIIREKKKYITL